MILMVIDFNKLTQEEQMKYLIKNRNLHILLNEYGQGQRIITKLKEIGKTTSDFYLATKLYQYLPDNMHSGDKLEAVKFNLRLRKQLRLPQIHEDYAIEFAKPRFNQDGIAINIPVESGMQIDLIRLGGTRKIAAFNAFFITEGRKKILRINNIQGERNSANYLKELTNELKENWRVWVVKNLNRICVSKKIRLIGELPKLFNSGKPDSEYIRIIRQYIQTYLKAGLKPQNIDVRNIREYKIRKKFEEIIFNKEINKEIQEKRKVKKENKPKKPRLFKNIMH